jgi:hypothetical protein
MNGTFKQPCGIETQLAPEGAEELAGGGLNHEAFPHLFGILLAGSVPNATKPVSKRGPKSCDDARKIQHMQ